MKATLEEGGPGWVSAASFAEHDENKGPQGLVFDREYWAELSHPNTFLRQKYLFKEEVAQATYFCHAPLGKALLQN